MSIRRIVFLCLSMIGAFTSCLSDKVKRAETLGSNGNFLANWEVDFETEIVVFTLDVKTTGFVGFGISGNPSMAGADIVIGGVRDDQGTPYFADYHAPANGFPLLDESQDWELLNASQSDGHTRLQFSRKLNTCDDNDVVMTADTQYLIWATGDSDEIGYHGADPSRRSSKITNLLDPPSPATDLTQFEIFQIRRNHDLLPQDTSYWCTIHRAPDFNGTKHHIVAFNTTLGSEKTIKHTHHIGIYSCVPPTGHSTDYFEQFLDHPGEDCFGENTFLPMELCEYAVYIWTVGGEMLVLPEMTGYPVGDSGHREYFMFEVHVDNPGLETGRFESGVDMFYTSNLREIDAGIFDIAHNVSPLQIVPPHATDFVNIGHCSSECTSALIPEEGITLFNIMFHAHKAAKKMRARIIRDGIELPWIAVDNHYNFDYQTNRPIQQYVKVLPGDHLITECTYDTSTRPNVTIGGHPSTYEMCRAFTWHYPRVVRLCASTADPDLNRLFDIESYNVSTYYDEPIITKPDKITGLKFSDYLNTIEWTDDLKSRLQHELRYGQHKSSCLGAPIAVSYPVIRQEFVEDSVCGSGDNSRANFVKTFSFSLLLVVLAKMSF